MKDYQMTVRYFNNKREETDEKSCCIWQYGWGKVYP